MEATERCPLHLLYSQRKTCLHGQYDNGSVSLASKINGRGPIGMYPDAVTARGIRTGDVVRVFNDCNAFLADVRLDTGMRADIVVLATGACYDRLAPGEMGTLDKHGNPNVLTLDKGTSKLGQSAIAHTVLVQVERYVGQPPQITAFDPSDLVQPAVDVKASSCPCLDIFIASHGHPQTEARK